MQSVHDAEVREINGLERRIAKSEDDTDAALWDQARKVAALLSAGMTQRDLASQWVNVRTGKPHSHVHVVYTVKALGKFTYQPRPRFRDAYNEVANAKPESGGVETKPFNFTAALFRIHDVLVEIYDASSETDRKRLIADLRAFLNTIETRTYK